MDEERFNEEFKLHSKGILEK